MKLIYHIGTGTIIDIDNDVYIIDTDDMTETENQALEEGDDHILEDVVETGRGTLLVNALGNEFKA